MKHKIKPQDYTIDLLQHSLKWIYKFMETNTYLTLQNTKYQLDSNTFKQKFNPKLNCKSNFKS